MGTQWLVPNPGGSLDAGWEFGLPPGITSDQWPRHRTSGLPLQHGFTVKVAEEHRVRGTQLVALSYFHPGDSESFPPADEQVARVHAVFAGGDLETDESGHPFWRAVKAHAVSQHPATVLLSDILDHDHAIIWHTKLDADGPRCPRPETVLPDGIDGEAMQLEDPVPEEVALAVVGSRPDQPHIQFGLPLHPVQDTVEQLREMGFGEHVMEIETDVGGANYGDGNCQIDLLNNLLDWACT